MMKGDDIKRLIPQRYPMMMVDEFECQDDQTAITSLTIRKDNYFLHPWNELAETGLIEHMAQSCSALAGYLSMKRGEAEPPVGMIAEVKHFTCHRRPSQGEKIVTSMTFGFSFGQMILATGNSKIGDEVIAEMEIKLFIK